MVRKVKKLNPLANTKAMLRLNPYAAVLKRAAILTAQKRQHEKDVLLAKKRGVSTSCSLYYKQLTAKRNVEFQTLTLFHSLRLIYRRVHRL